MKNNIQLPDSVAKDLIQRIKTVNDKVSDINDLDEIGTGFLITTNWFQSLPEKEQKSVLEKGALKLLKDFGENNKANKQTPNQKQINYKKVQDMDEEFEGDEEISRNKFFYVFDLIPPILFTILIYQNLYSKVYKVYENYSLDLDINEGTITTVFFIIFISIVFIEWYRRSKHSHINEPFYYKFLYIAFILLFFIIGIWYVNQLVEVII